MARLSKAALADGKVVALPGAATRKPDNYRFAAQRQAATAARIVSPFPQRFRFPSLREADRLAAELDAITPTPESLVLSAILKTMDADTVTRIKEQLALGVAAGNPLFCQAFALVQASRLNVGQTIDLQRAMSDLRKGDGR